jgi:hypothetical protein
MFAQTLLSPFASCADCTLFQPVGKLRPLLFAKVSPYRQYAPSSIRKLNFIPPQKNENSGGYFRLDPTPL